MSPFVRRHVEPRVNGWLAGWGLRIGTLAGANPLDLSDFADLHPVAVAHESAGRSVLIRVPLARCRHFNWLAFPCTPISASPFVQTLFAHVHERCERYEDSPLARFYAAFRPQSAAQLMGLVETEAPFFAALPPHASPYPWQRQPPQQRAAVRAEQVRRDNREHGARFGLLDGDPFFGPVSARKGDLEFQRLLRVYASIRDGGFRVDETGIENIRMVCLLSEDAADWRFIVAGSGQHRLAALTTLHENEAILQWSPSVDLVRRADAAHWPAVRRGEMTLEQAQSVFDRIFAGQQPEGFEKY